VRLQSKILLLLIPLTVLPLVALGWVAYGELQRTSQQNVLDGLQGTLDHIRESFGTLEGTAAANLGLFAKASLVHEYLNASARQRTSAPLQDSVLRLFSTFQEAFPAYFEIRLLLPDGHEAIRRTTRSIDNLTQEEAESPLFKALSASGDLAYHAVLPNPDTGELALFVSRAIMLQDPSFDATPNAPTLRGYLVVSVDLSALAAQIETTRIGRSGYLVATDETDAIMYQPKDLSLPSRLPLHLHDIPESAADPLTVVTAKVGGVPSYVHAVHLVPGFHLLAVLPEPELTAISRKLALIVGAIMLVAIAVTTVCVYLLLNKLVIRPIRQLGSMTEQIGRGELHVDAAPFAGDEIGELGNAFRAMAANLRRSHEQIRYTAYHDNLTGLPNRALFRDYLSRVIDDTRRHQRQFALLFLDIDDFKRVNDTLGHQAGDRLLQNVTQRLSHCLRGADYLARMDSPCETDRLLARLGGDEFVVLLPEVGDVQAPSALAKRLIEVLSETISVDEHEFFISASIGITLFPSDASTADDLIKNADIAMYHAKEHGKNQYRYYLESMNVVARERVEMESMLRKAVENDELCLRYQPQIDAASGQVCGIEALLRWQHPQHGLVRPEMFLAVAEKTGLILGIGAWVIDEACRQIKEWKSAGVTVPMVSVNISEVQFERQEVPRLIRAALERHDIEPRQFGVEITEDAIMAQPERTVQDLAAIRRLDVGIALDDFGTGYSSFAYLHRFPIDTLKIDVTFVRELGNESANTEIVAAILAMAHTLKLRVVAEGIEYPRQYTLLSECGCNALQGRLLSDPLSADQMLELLANDELNWALAAGNLHFA
jgi:diguanylate cyclase (GGDEF)-like protein